MATRSRSLGNHEYRQYRSSDPSCRLWQPPGKERRTRLPGGTAHGPGHLPVSTA